MNATIRHLLDRSLRALAPRAPAPPSPQTVAIPRLPPAKEMQDLKRSVLDLVPENPCLKAYKVFSQNEEDGIIEEILSHVAKNSPPNRRFLEIGCGNGLENNSHYLLLKGYRGCWIDGDVGNIDFIRTQLGGLDFAALCVRQHFVDLSNIEGIIGDTVTFLETREPDFFSLDIDGNDRWVVEQALRHFEPKVLCVEYNAKFPPPLSVSIAYCPTHRWAGDDYHGASLQAFCDCLPGYELVSCDLCGVNAFFVRRDLAIGFPAVGAKSLYQPFREHLTAPRVGHPPTLKWLRDKLMSPGPAFSGT